MKHLVKGFVQRIAELHEAKIEIYNRDEGGLAVEVWLSPVLSI